MTKLHKNCFKLTVYFFLWFLPDNFIILVEEIAFLEIKQVNKSGSWALNTG